MYMRARTYIHAASTYHPCDVAPSSSSMYHAIHTHTYMHTTHIISSGTCIAPSLTILPFCVPCNTHTYIHAYTHIISSGTCIAPRLRIIPLLCTMQYTYIQTYIHTYHTNNLFRHVPSLRDYAFFLYYVRRDYIGAENMFLRALDESPKEIDVLSA